MQMTTRKRTYSTTELSEASNCATNGTQIKPDNKRRRVNRPVDCSRDESEKVTMIRSENLADSEWKVTLMGVDAVTTTSHTYNCASLLFQPKMSDWNTYIVPHQRAYIAFLEDTVGVWRSATWFYVYDAKRMAYDADFIVKIVLTATDLHYRRQKLGSMMIDFIVATLPRLLATNNFALVSLVMDSQPAQKFWAGNQFTVIDETTSNQLEKLILTENETDIDLKMLTDSTEPSRGLEAVSMALQELIVQRFDAKVREFAKPTYVDFCKRYATASEVEELERLKKEQPVKEFTLEESNVMSSESDDSDFSLAEDDEDCEFESDTE